MTDDKKRLEKIITPVFLNNSFEATPGQIGFNETLDDFDEYVRRHIDPIGPRLQNGTFYSPEALCMQYMQEFDRNLRFAKKEDFREGLYNKNEEYLPQISPRELDFKEDLYNKNEEYPPQISPKKLDFKEGKYKFINNIPEPIDFRKR